MRRRLHPGVWFALLFALVSYPFISKAGLQVDNSNELGCFFTCAPPLFESRLFGLGTRVPTMVLPYQGAFKAWLYRPLFRFLPVTLLLIRIPTLLIGAITVWMLFLFLDQIHGRRAALTGAFLLATDVTFVIATTF